MYDLEYADDTLLLSLTTPQLQSMLNALEEQAAFHGMKLHYEKTEILYRPKFPPPAVRYCTGEQVKTTTQIRAKPFEVAYQHRAGLIETACKKFRLIWNSFLSKKKSSTYSNPPLLAHPHIRLVCPYPDR